MCFNCVYNMDLPADFSKKKDTLKIALIIIHLFFFRCCSTSLSNENHTLSVGSQSIAHLQEMK